MSVSHETTVLQENQQRRRRQIDALCQAGKLTREQARQIQDARPQSQLPLDEELEQLGLLPGASVGRALAEHFGCRFVDLSGYAINREAAPLLPADIARQFTALPLGCKGETALVALSDPSDVLAEDTVRSVIPRTVEFVVAAESHLRRSIELLYGSGAESSMAGLEIKGLPTPDISIDVQESESLSSQELEFQAERLPVIRLANQIIGMAASRNASDIHLEPQQAELHVRLRVDGMLQDALTLPRSIQPALLSRLKLMGEMDISDTRRPQDGRCRININRRVLDLRISSLPTTFGEKLVIRMLDQSGPPMTLERLELDPENREAMQRMLSQPQGLILVTGPTGSGKSTTLYASLCHLQKRAGNIVTVEDPVERQIPGINQVGINEKAGVTFAVALKSILRQDPNVIMIGEIRDQETMEIALKAGLTGHLVLSTLHTGDAASTITRLLDMGMPGRLLSPALIGIVAQRLIRRLCDKCKRRVDDDAPSDQTQPDHQRRTRGCEACGFTGFRGRVGLYEVMENTPDLSALISRGASADEIRAAARLQGMRSLAEAAMQKAEQGIIASDEAAAIADTRTSRTAPSATLTAGAVRPNRLAADEAATATVVMNPAHAEGREIPPDEALESLLSPRILIVEDDENIRVLLRYMLESHLYQVTTVENGMEGLKTAAAELPDLIISDVMMPVMDGFELCKRLRANPRTRSIPIIMLTAQDGEEEEVRGLEVGADDYIQKPVRPRGLLARIHNVLGRTTGG